MNELFISCSMEIGVMFEAVTSDIGGDFYNMRDTVPRFAARRSYRPKAMFAGVAFLVGCMGLAAVLALSDGAAIAPYVVGAGAIGYFVATIAAMIPQRVTIEISGGTVTPSWRPPITEARVELSSWVTAGIDAAMGLAVTIRGHGGKLVIGGDGHDGEGYELRGAPVRSVTCHLPKDEIESLIAALGIARGAPGPLVLPLVRSNQSLGGLLRMMGPWLITISVLGVLGGVLGNTSLGEQAMRSWTGQLAIAAGSVVIVLIGIGFMVVRGRRVRLPELELRDDGDALVIADLRRGTTRRIRWQELELTRLRYIVGTRMGSYTMPVLELKIPDAKPLRVVAWDQRLAWPGEPPKAWRAPTWIAGAARWPKLVDVLQRNRRL